MIQQDRPDRRWRRWLAINHSMRPLFPTATLCLPSPGLHFPAALARRCACVWCSWRGEQDLASETTAGPQGSQLGLGHEENRGAEEKKKGNWGISEFKAHWCHDRQKQKAPTQRSPRLGRSTGEGESLGRSGKGVPAHRLEGPSSSWGCCEHSPPDTALLNPAVMPPGHACAVSPSSPHA